MAEMNQRVGGPYGDIVIVNTPQLDRLGQQFYQQDLKRKKENEAAAKAYDKELQNDLTKVRPADIPDNVKLYNDYKLARINLLKKGDKATPLDHQAVLQKQADYFRHTNDSIREKQLEQDAQKRVLSKPDDFNENANSYLADRRKIRVEDINTPLPLPTSIRSGTKPTVIDESDIYSIIKNPDDNNDYSKYVLKARGEILPRGEYTRQKSPDGLTTQVTQYKAGNSPDEYLMHLQTLGDKTLNGISKKFNYSDEEAQKIMDDYNALKETPAFKASFPNQREISPELLKTKRGRNLALMAMENALMHPPTPVTKTERNLKEIMDANERNRVKMENLRNQHSLERMNKRKQLGLGVDEDTMGISIDELGGNEDVEIKEEIPQYAGNAVKKQEGALYSQAKARISNGIVFNSDGGVKKDGTVLIKRDQLPANFLATMKINKIPVDDEIKATVKDGQIETVKPSSTAGVLSRQNIMDMQKVLKKKAGKDEDWQFGKEIKTTKPVTPIKSKKVTDPELLKKLNGK